MSMSIYSKCYGASPVTDTKAGAVPGPRPRKSPTPSTGCFHLPCEARRHENKTTQTSV
uniref:Uncharacterized protein n=1 Tax=Arion vulgaris TaxID=1028688 RepID=A0A0B7A8Q3_9EUPU